MSFTYKPMGAAAELCTGLAVPQVSIKLGADYAQKHSYTGITN